MNPSFDVHKLTRIAATAIGLLFALWAGSTIGSGNYTSVFLIVIVILGTLTATILGSSVWWLIPIGYAIGGSLPMVPGGFSLHELACLFTFGTFVILKTVKAIPTRPVYGLADVVLFVLLLQLLTTYIRNPVGLLLFESDRVGGRPYASIAIAWMGYWVLAHIKITPKLAFRFPIILTGLTLVGAIKTGFSYFAPGMGAGASAQGGFGAGEDQIELGETRVSAGSALGARIIQSLCSYYRPLSNFHPLRFGRLALFAFAFVAITLSGFRTAIISAGLFFFVAQFYWGRFRDILYSLVIGCVMIGGLLVVQSHMPLPSAIQRSLSFLPGNWDQEVVYNARGSIEWRVEMWKQLFEDSRYLQNKWLGDGFGMSKETVRTNMGVARTPEQLQEHYLEVGEVHSGPLSTIRYVGYVGLGLYLVLILLVAKKAHHLIRNTKGTLFFPFAMFIGISAITFPLRFIFIYGLFHESLALTMFSLAMLKVIQNSFDAHLANEAAQKELAKTSEPAAVGTTTRRAIPLA